MLTWRSLALLISKRHDSAAVLASRSPKPLYQSPGERIYKALNTGGILSAVPPSIDTLPRSALMRRRGPRTEGRGPADGARGMPRRSHVFALGTGKTRSWSRSYIFYDTSEGANRYTGRVLVSLPIPSWLQLISHSTVVCK
jgi:hypothetical protein